MKLLRFAEIHHLQTTPHFVNAFKELELLVLDEADHLLQPMFLRKASQRLQRLKDTLK